MKDLGLKEDLLIFYNYGGMDYYKGVNHETKLALYAKTILIDR